MLSVPSPARPHIVTTAEGQVVPTKQGLALHGAAGRAMGNAATPVFTSRCSRDHHMGHPSWPQSSLTKLYTLVSQNMQTQPIFILLLHDGLK